MEAVKRVESLGIKNGDLALITYYHDSIENYSSIFKIKILNTSIEGELIHQLQYKYFWQEDTGQLKSWFTLPKKSYDIKKISEKDYPEYYI